MSSDVYKSFHDLEIEVQARGLCNQCGGCVSFCSAGEFNVLGIDGGGYPCFIDKEKCLKCGICYLICPEIKELERDVRKAYKWVPPIGAYKRAVSARSTDNRVLEVCTDGGVVTSLLAYMLEHRIVSGALVARKVSPFKREPMIARTYQDLIEAAGFYSYHSLHLEMLGEKYSTYSTTLPSIKDFKDDPHSRLALVGTPCQVNTIRKMQRLRVFPSHVIRLTIGLFCMENFCFDSLVQSKKMQEKLGGPIEEVRKLNIKEDLIVHFMDGRVLHLPFEDVDEFARPACLMCTDFANDFADISVGGLGSPDGYTTTLLRTEKGQEVYSRALKAGYIREISYKSPLDQKKDEIRLIEKVISFAERKRERNERNKRARGVDL